MIKTTVNKTENTGVGETYLFMQIFVDVSKIFILNLVKNICKNFSFYY